MALALRKAVLARNVSLLKCIKGRNIATTANKKNPAIMTAACIQRHLRERCSPMRRDDVWKTDCAKRISIRDHKPKVTTLRATRSCPALRPAKMGVPLRHRSPSPTSSCNTRSHSCHMHLLPHCPLVNFIRSFSSLEKTCKPEKPKPACPPAACPPVKPFSSLDKICAKPDAKAKCPPYPSTSNSKDSSKKYTCKAGCPCPFPCGPCGNSAGCCCLPPPCNTPPRCIQYMTGYYYYPYGFWFCGPYHVSGTCVPVSCAAPCGKCCPAPCCICPAMTAAAGLDSISTIPIQPTPQRQPSQPMNQPLRQPMPITYQCPEPEQVEMSNKPAVSKFFPFTTALSPNVCQAKTAALSAISPLSSYAPSRKFGTSEYPVMLKDISGKSNSMSPRELPRATERDRPAIYPDQFDMSAVPKYENPFRSHKSINDSLGK